MEDRMGTVKNATYAALAASLCAALLWSGPSSAQTPVDGATKDAARNLAMGVCASCHGPEGRSTDPLVPRLAGQQRMYIEAQLKSFRTQSRSDPAAHDYMWGVAATLNDSITVALADYYSSQPPVPGTPGDSPTSAAGKQLYEKGDPGRGIQACATCHGANAQGTSIFPRLAGQHSEYLVKQMQMLRVRLRASPVMHGVLKDITDADISALAGYLQSK
jgi:cytochrome c553